MLLEGGVDTFEKEFRKWIVYPLFDISNVNVCWQISYMRFIESMINFAKRIDNVVSQIYGIPTS